jgi:hypothetical protein
VLASLPSAALVRRVPLARRGAPWVRAGLAGATAAASAAATVVAIVESGAWNGIVLMVLPLVAITTGTSTWFLRRAGAAMCQVEVTGDRAEVPVGGALHVAWAVRTPLPMRRGTVDLVGVEEVISSDGNGVEARRHVFYRHTLGALAGGRACDGDAIARIPAGAVPSFVGTSNRVVWLLEVSAEVPLWSDVQVDVELQVVAPGARA